MTSNPEPYLTKSLNNLREDGEVDINQISSIFKKNKKLIGGLSLTGLLLSGLIAFTTKRVWQGEFQIVLSNQDSQSQNAAKIFDTLGIKSDNNSDELQTEVEILKSPSILMDIFNFVKSKKTLLDKSQESLRFRIWEKSLKIGLVEDTSILNITYQDTDRNLILPVLKQISNTYQEYSGKKRARDLELTLDYYKNQIENYKNKLKEANIKIKQTSNLQKEKQILPLEDPIKKRYYDSSQVLAAVSKYPNLKSIVKKSLVDLQRIEAQIISLSPYVRSTDISIERLKRQRDNITKTLSKILEGYLSENLYSDAIRNKAALEELESNYLRVLNEEKRIIDPWELITEPTLLPYPVAPQKKLIVFIGLLLGFASGLIIALFRETKNGIIYSKSLIESLSKAPVFGKENSYNQNSFEEIIALISSNNLLKESKDCAFIVIGEINTSQEQSIENKLKIAFEKNSLLVTRKVNDAIEYSKIVLITKLGCVKIAEVNDISQKLSLAGKSIFSILLVD